MTDCRVVPLGDSCLSVIFEEAVDPAINARCVAVAEALTREARVGIRDIVPAYHTVAVYFDPLKVGRAGLIRDLFRMAAGTPASAIEMPTPIEVAVRYGGESGPDLPSVAAFAGCSEEEVVRIHTGTVYRVYMLGFLPGFAYLGAVDRRIAIPRLDAPRVGVPAGSVGIAGEQTGIYPCESPGGWRIIGRTGARPFDAGRSEAFLFAPGQAVTFVAA
jgi:inhibitor of KinA